jgi:hypothetical protein
VSQVGQVDKQEKEGSDVPVETLHGGLDTLRASRTDSLGLLRSQ